MLQEVTALQGSSAFQIWRSLYFSKMMSNRNRFQVAFDWTCKSIFGREISTPYILEEDNGVAKTDPSEKK